MKPIQDSRLKSVMVHSHDNLNHPHENTQITSHHAPPNSELTVQITLGFGHHKKYSSPLPSSRSNDLTHSDSRKSRYSHPRRSVIPRRPSERIQVHVGSNKVSNSKTTSINDKRTEDTAYSFDSYDRYTKHKRHANKMTSPHRDDDVERRLNSALGSPPPASCKKELFPFKKADSPSASMQEMIASLERQLQELKQEYEGSKITPATPVKMTPAIPWIDLNNDLEPDLEEQSTNEESLTPNKRIKIE